MMLTKLQIKALRKLSRSPEASDYPGGTARTNIDNALEFIEKTLPDFRQRIAGKDVLDFGCGLGHQTVAMARAGARSVTGVDLPRSFLQTRWDELRKLGLNNINFRTGEIADQFDVVISCSSFEHFSDPAMILGLMRDRVRPGGQVLITFAEPWFSPRGSHSDGWTQLPWVNLIFPEHVVMEVRRQYRSDGARHYEDVEGGLNRMTVAKFERLIAASGLEIQEKHPLN